MPATKRKNRIAFPILLKSVLVSAALLTATTLLLGVTWFMEASTHLERSMLAGLSGLVHARAGQLNGIVEQDFERAALVASRTRLRQCVVAAQDERSNAYTDQIQRILMDAQRSVDAISELQVFDAEGKLLATTGAVSSGSRERATAQECVSSNTFRRTCLEYVEGAVFYDVWCPMANPQPEQSWPVGALRCRFAADRVLDVLADRIGLGRTGELVLFRAVEHGALILNPLRHTDAAPLTMTVESSNPAAPPFLLALGGRTGYASDGFDYRSKKVLTAYAPVEKGRWGLIAKIDSREALAPARRLGAWTVKAGAGALIAGILAAVLFSKFLTRPMLDLREAARALATGNFNYRVDVRTRDETGELARTFNRMAQRIKVITASRDELNLEVEERVAAEQRLTQAMSELQTLNSQMMDDLRMAREIQYSLMTVEHPDFVRSRDGQSVSVRFNHCYKPCWALGGDFFDIRPIGEGKVMATLCDVMGHGLRAALVTAIIRGLLEDLPSGVECPALVLGFLNDGLLKILPQQDQLVFVTACCVIVDPLAGRSQWEVAGHPSPVKISADGRTVGEFFSDEEEVAPVLGLDENPGYRPKTVELKPGDSLVMFTDGAFEVTDCDGLMLGEDGLRELFRRHAGGRQRALECWLDSVISDIDRCAGTEELEDDVCILSLTLLAESEICLNEPPT